MNKAVNNTQIETLIEIMGSKKRECLAELFMTEAELREMNDDQFRCAQANIVEWLNDFYGVRRK